MPNFTTPCLFRPRDEQQRKDAVEWLQHIGYLTKDIYKPEKFIIITLPEDNFAMFSDPYNLSFNYLSDCCNCGSNLDLFKSLTALRDDSDYMQWFVSNSRSKNITDYWFMCFGDNYVKWCKDNPPLYNSKILAHKATKEELIERFKTE